MKTLLYVRILFMVVMLGAAGLVSAAEKESKQAVNELPIVCIICSYNNSEWYKKNLDSVFSQDYRNYHVIYCDDCSPDNTGSLVEAYIQEHDLQERCTLIKNNQRAYKMANLYKAGHMCPDNAIIVELDGDDWLPNETIFSRINETYQQQDVWLTYGHFLEWPQNVCTRDMLYAITVTIPPAVIEKNSFRSVKGCIWAGLRTYYAWLFKRIKLQDLMYKGAWLTRTSDTAIMLPMYEMAGSRYAFIDDILLVHNCATPLNDHKVDRDFQYKLELYIRGKKPYDRLPNNYVHTLPGTIRPTYAVISKLQGESSVEDAVQNYAVSGNEPRVHVLSMLEALSADYLVIVSDHTKVPDEQIVYAGIDALKKTAATFFAGGIDVDGLVQNKVPYIKIDDALGGFNLLYGSLKAITVFPIIIARETLCVLLRSMKTLTFQATMHALEHQKTDLLAVFARSSRE